MEFSEFIGNQDIVKSIQSKAGRDDGPHAWLFTGPSGCGKTTLARILAKELECDPQVGIFELNISDTRGIDAARDLIAKMHYRPMRGKSVVYILDEVQSATSNFQQAILKALEDTPNHVHFILCTTDPQKLLKTIKNRCASYEVKPMGLPDMASLFKWVLEAEQVEIPEKVLRHIWSASDGSPRQALVMLEQVIDLSGADEMLSALSNSGVSDTEIKQLCQALLDRTAKWGNVATILKGLVEKDPEKVRWAVLGYMNSVLLNKGSQPVAMIIECFSEPFTMSGNAGLTLACYLSKNS